MLPKTHEHQRCQKLYSIWKCHTERHTHIPSGEVQSIPHMNYILNREITSQSHQLWDCKIWSVILESFLKRWEGKTTICKMIWHVKMKGIGSRNKCKNNFSYKREGLKVYFHFRVCSLLKCILKFRLNVKDWIFKIYVWKLHCHALHYRTHYRRSKSIWASPGGRIFNKMSIGS